MEVEVGCNPNFYCKQESNAQGAGREGYPTQVMVARRKSSHSRRVDLDHEQSRSKGIGKLASFQTVDAVDTHTLFR